MTLNLATADLFHAEIARLQAEIELLEAASKASHSALAVIDSGFKNALAEIERLRSQPCPYVTGTVTQHCTLTPLTLTDAEREALKFVVSEGHVACQFECDILRGLLERTAL